MSDSNDATVNSEPDYYLRVLRDVLVERLPHRTLVVSGDHKILAGAGVCSPCCVRLNTGKSVEWSSLRCAVSSMPFARDAFDLVVLHEVVNQRDGDIIANARRCMPSGATLLVMGSARLSGRNVLNRSSDAVALQPEWLIRHLPQMSFIPRHLQGQGILGLPLATGSGLGWRRPLLGCSDQVVIRARRSEHGPNIQLVRFARPRRAVRQPMGVEGMNRENGSMSKESA